MSGLDLASGKLGDEGSYDVDFTGGAIDIKVTYDSPYASGTLTVNIGLLDVMRMAAAKTDNKIDDTLVGLIASALD